MKKSFVPTLAAFIFLAASLHAQTTAPTTPSPIPEEARRHFVMGTALFKDAKTHDDYVEAGGPCLAFETWVRRMLAPRANFSTAKHCPKA